MTNSSKEKESVSKEWDGRRNNETKLREYNFKRQNAQYKSPYSKWTQPKESVTSHIAIWCIRKH